MVNHVLNIVAVVSMVSLVAYTVQYVESLRIEFQKIADVTTLLATAEMVTRFIRKDVS